MFRRKSREKKHSNYATDFDLERVLWDCETQKVVWVTELTRLEKRCNCKFSLLIYVDYLPHIQGCPRESRRQESQDGRRFPLSSAWERRPRGCTGRRRTRRNPRGTVRPLCRCASCSSPALPLLLSVQGGRCRVFGQPGGEGDRDQGKEKQLHGFQFGVSSLNSIEVFFGLMVAPQVFSNWESQFVYSLGNCDSFFCCSAVLNSAIKIDKGSDFKWTVYMLSAVPRTSEEHLILQNLWQRFLTMFAE